MREHVDRQQRSNRETRAAGVNDKERKAIEERTEAHRRWVGDDSDDGACRGID